MRCKNCGSQNDDNLYICQNCGSPLYDEDDSTEQEGFTKVVPPIKNNPQMQERRPSRNADNTDDDKKKNKNLTIIIIVLCVVLVALIAGIIAIAANGNKKPEETTNPIGTTADEGTSQNDYTTRPVTAASTSETTSETTTESTTESTTASTTKVKTYTVALSCNAGGEVEGDGQYKAGEKVIIFARADDGYEFDGWYQNGRKISESTSYRFNIDSDIKIKAKFLQIDEGGDEDLDDDDDEFVEE